MSRFSRTVWLLALISFFTDLASEMLYPVMPLYLSDLGYGLVFVGLLEGVALLVVGAMKLYSGLHIDRSHNHVGFIRLGYGLSAVVKPLMGLVSTYWPIFGLRIGDRIGKGLRGTPRDALLTLESTPTSRGTIFGFHRTLDSLGATVGPLVALGILFLHPDNLQMVFFATAIPGAIALILTFMLRSPKVDSTPVTNESAPNSKLWQDAIAFYKTSTADYRILLWLFLAIAVLKSTDMFLLIRAKELGLSATWVIGCYMLYQFTYASLSYALGSMADKRGFRIAYTIGLSGLVITYGLLAAPELPLGFIILSFVVYGVFSAAYDGLSSAWLSLTAPRDKSGTALGVYYAFQAIAGLIGSLAIALLWTEFGARPVFLGIALSSLVVLILLQRMSNTTGSVQSGGCSPGH